MLLLYNLVYSYFSVHYNTLLITASCLRYNTQLEVATIFLKGIPLKNMGVINLKMEFF